MCPYIDLVFSCKLCKTKFVTISFFVRQWPLVTLHEQVTVCEVGCFLPSNILNRVLAYLIILSQSSLGFPNSKHVKPKPVIHLICSPRDSQGSSPTPQFKSINSSALSFVYGPTLTSMHNYWKNLSFDYMDFVSKGLSLLFNMLARFVIAFLPRSRVF